MLRLTVQLCIELVLTIVFAFVGLGLLLGTVDEYRAGNAFNTAMDNYSARSMEDVHDFLNQAIEAKPEYSPPQEVLGKLLIDEGTDDPRKYDEARKLFEALRTAQEGRSRKAALPVLIGLAVADLEAARAQNPTGETLRRAVTEARVRFEKALDEYPNSGDLHVNLATVALLASNPALCKRHLAKAREVGNISIDALPFLYNLSGLAALQERKAQTAIAEFEKVKEFAPDWEVPRLNLAAAYARSLFRGKLTERTAETYARTVAHAVSRLSKSRNPLLPMLCHALAVHSIHKGNINSALGHFRRAEKFGKLSWKARFNKAIALYVSSRAPRVQPKQRAALLDEAIPTLKRALRSSRSRRRDAFVATAILGTIHAQREELDPAIASFESALKTRVSHKDPFIRKAIPRVHRSLAALYYTKGDYKRARIHLDASKSLSLEEKRAATLLGQLNKRPAVRNFTANLGKIHTDFDLRVRATLSANATPDPIGRKNVRLTLVNHTTKTTRPLPFILDGPRLHALILNLPQGHQTVQLQVADGLGNTSEVASKTFDIDREAPRVLARTPAPKTTVAKLETIDFKLHDVMGGVDLYSLSVMLKYPRNAKTATRFLVSHGKFLHTSRDKTIKKGSKASETVRCPVPEGTPSGKYAVTVRVRDVAGKLCDSEWEFTLR